MSNVKYWVDGKGLFGSLRDSAYGRIPAQAGPSEGVSIRLIPVDKTKDGVELSSGTVNRKRSRRIKQ